MDGVRHIYERYADCPGEFNFFDAGFNGPGFENQIWLGIVRENYMRKKRPFKVIRKKESGKDDTRSVEDIVMKIKQGGPSSTGYREESLRIHGLICAKCGREFDSHNRNLLTVHHKDGNHSNNPPDGSNWENLCIYCHDD